jgi:hypothetical protein
LIPLNPDAEPETNNVHPCIIAYRTFLPGVIRATTADQLPAKSELILLSFILHSFYCRLRDSGAPSSLGTPERSLPLGSFWFSNARQRREQAMRR